MKEFVHNINPEDYHAVVYPLVVSGDQVGQHTLEGELLIVPNPEKYEPIKTSDPVPLEPDKPRWINPNTKSPYVWKQQPLPEIVVTHGAQAEMRFIKPFSNSVIIKK